MRLIPKENSGTRQPPINANVHPANAIAIISENSIVIAPIVASTGLYFPIPQMSLSIDQPQRLVQFEC